MNCTCSLTVEKILQDILLIVGLNDSSCKGKGLGQCLTFLVSEIECKVSYIDLAFEGFRAVPPQISWFATVKTIVVALEGIDIHRNAWLPCTTPVPV